MSEIRNFSDIAISIMTNLTESERSLPSIWKKVVSKVNKYGDRLCGNTRVVDYKNGVLLIETDHPGWNQIMNIYQTTMDLIAKDRLKKEDFADFINKQID